MLGFELLVSRGASLVVKSVAGTAFCNTFASLVYSKCPCSPKVLRRSSSKIRKNNGLRIDPRSIEG